MITKKTWVSDDGTTIVIARLVGKPETDNYPPGTKIKMVIRKIIHVAKDGSYTDVRSEVFLYTSGTLASTIRKGQLYYLNYLHKLK